MCRSVARRSDFFSFAYPFHLFSSLRVKHIEKDRREEEKKRQNEVIAKGVVVNLSVYAFEREKKRRNRKEKRVGRETRTTTDDGN
jgi:hypothetical protein